MIQTSTTLACLSSLGAHCDLATTSSSGNDQTSMQFVSENLGTLFGGFTMSAILTGTLCYQSWVYFSQYPNDGAWVISLVSLIVALDTASTALVSNTIYTNFVRDFLGPVVPMRASSTLLSEMIIAGIIVFLVKGFYSFRIWKSNGSHTGIVSSVIFICSIIEFASTSASTVLLWEVRLISLFKTSKMTATMLVSLCSGLVADVTIVSFLASSPHTLVYETERDVWWFDRFVAKLLEGGLLFSLTRVAFLLTFLIAPSRPIWMPLHLVLSKIYANSLLAMINWRKSIHGRGILTLYEDNLSSSLPKPSRPGTRVETTTYPSNALYRSGIRSSWQRTTTPFDTGTDSGRYSFVTSLDLQMANAPTDGTEEISVPSDK